MGRLDKCFYAAAVASAMVITLGGGGGRAADYGPPPMEGGAVAPSGQGQDGFAYLKFGFTGHGYTPYGYGGYIGPYYRFVCYGDPYDCGPIQPHRYVRRVKHAAYKP